jgi:hypothetical protein
MVFSNKVMGRESSTSSLRSKPDCTSPRSSLHSP